jgi:hypothetical protein
MRLISFIVAARSVVVFYAVLFTIKCRKEVLHPVDLFCIFTHINAN